MVWLLGVHFMIQYVGIWLIAPMLILPTLEKSHKRQLEAAEPGRLD